MIRIESNSIYSGVKIGEGKLENGDSSAHSDLRECIDQMEVNYLHLIRDNGRQRCCSSILPVMTIAFDDDFIIGWPCGRRGG